MCVDFVQLDERSTGDLLMLPENSIKNWFLNFLLVLLVYFCFVLSIETCEILKKKSHDLNFI